MAKRFLRSGSAFFLTIMLSSIMFIYPARLPADGLKTLTGLLTPPVVKAQPIMLSQFIHLPSEKELSESEAALYARIFFLQENGVFDKADQEIQKVKNGLLIGHVFAQRFLHKDYKARFDELDLWLKRFGDHPDADDLYKLAERRQGENDPKPHAPKITSQMARGVYDVVAEPSAYEIYRQKTVSTQKKSSQRQKVRAQIDKALNDNAPTKALKILNTKDATSAFNTIEYDQMRGEIASQYYYLGKRGEAYGLAHEAADRSLGYAPLACWIAGLSAYGKNDFKTAAHYFSALAHSKQATPWMIGAGAYWTARSYFQAQEPEKVSSYLRKAADYPRTFYGLISVKILGLHDVTYNWNVPMFNSAMEERFLALPQGRRALALLKAGQEERASQELLTIDPEDDDVLRHALISLVHTYKVAPLAMRFGSVFRRDDKTLYDSLLYPKPNWTPKGGFTLDPALLFAFMRQESKFDPKAESSSGARGLMQLMPKTAFYLSEKHEQLSAVNNYEALEDPEMNMAMGQKYLSDLLKDKSIDHNLFKLVAAYNAGPGRLQQWLKEGDYVDDPLLFIESIPSAETRIFVERVMANYWIYRLQMGKSVKSLEIAASGGWPIYEDDLKP